MMAMTTSSSINVKARTGGRAWQLDYVLVTLRVTIPHAEREVYIGWAGGFYMNPRPGKVRTQ